MTGCARANRVCRFCSKVFSPARERSFHCSRVCRDRDRRAQERALRRKPRACRDCGTDISERYAHAISCAPCIDRRRRATAPRRERHLRNTATVATGPRACRDCGTDISERHANAVSCVPCYDRRHRGSASRKDRYHRNGRPSAARVVVGRTCADCGTSIDDRNHAAKRCLDCAPTARKRDRPALEQRSTKALRRRDPVKLAAPKPKKVDPLLPNFAGDWFPGWEGCWSPSISPEARERIRKRFGPDPDPMELMRRHKQLPKQEDVA